MLDIANHEISKLDSDFWRLIYKEIKKKYESDKLDLSEFLEKYSNENNSSDLFIVEPNDSNVLHCTQWGEDTFNYYTALYKKIEIIFYWLECSLKNINKLKAS